MFEKVECNRGEHCLLERLRGRLELTKKVRAIGRLK